MENMENLCYVQDGTKTSQTVALPITERDSELEKVIAREYECPVCLSFATPPIMTCLNSHVVCSDCWRRCTNCPTCRVAKTLTRAFTLEKIHPLITFPCRWDGCSFMANSSYTSIHEHLCNYYPLRCPLADSHQCDWIGTMKTVSQHLKDLHERNVYFEPEVLLLAKCFSKSVRKDYTVIFIIKGRLFKFYWSFDTSRSSAVRFGMVSIGNGNPIFIYNYSLVFANLFPITRNSRKFKIVKSEIKKSNTDCSLLHIDPSVSRPKIYNHVQNYTDLISFCNNGNLTYQVIIEVSRLVSCKKSV